MNSVYPRQETASRFRAAAWPYLSADDRELVDEWIDDVGEYALAVRVCVAAAIKNGATIDLALIADARRDGYEIQHQLAETV